MRRTAVVNQVRSLLLERGFTLPKGRSYVDEALPRILEDAELPLSGSFRLLLAQLKLELEQLSARIDQLDAVILKRAKEMTPVSDSPRFQEWAQSLPPL